MADAEFRDAATELVSALAATRAVPGRLRITVTAGPGPLGSGRTATPPTVIIAAAPAVPLPPTERVVRVPWVRNERSAVAGANDDVLCGERRRAGPRESAGRRRGDLCQHRRSAVRRHRHQRVPRPGRPAVQPTRWPQAAWPGSPASSCVNWSRSKSPVRSRSTTLTRRTRSSSHRRLAMCTR